MTINLLVELFKLKYIRLKRVFIIFKGKRTSKVELKFPCGFFLLTIIQGIDDTVLFSIRGKSPNGKNVLASRIIKFQLTINEIVV